MAVLVISGTSSSRFSLSLFVQGYFSIFKRGMKGVDQHCSEAHLHRYLSEFDFRYSTAWRSGSAMKNEPHAQLRAPPARD
jgi:ISXO2-like transposase domain